MAIYLVQHGKSLAGKDDPQQGLSHQGKEQTKTIAEVAKHYQVPVSEIKQSGKKRAEETAGIFAGLLEPRPPIHKITGIKPLDDVKLFSKSLDPFSNILYVGHLPFMERLTSYLTAGTQERRVFKFQNSGIVCLDKEDDHWFIKWALMPKVG